MKLLVQLEMDGQTVPVGQAFTDVRRGRLSSTFAYADSYLERRDAYPIDPALPLVSGNWPAAASLPRAFLDAAPDRWGRRLIDRRAAAQARANNTTPPLLTDVDYLLGVSDVARQGALRFKTTQDGPFEHPLDDVPKLIDLPTLVAASHAIATDGHDAEQAVKTLLSLGSASLGGARPKASVRDDGRLMIAKFAHSHDVNDVMAWEKTALDLAEQAGVDVPARRLIDVDGSSVLLVDRFDRTPDGQRVGYMSTMTLCEATDGDQRDYLEIAEHLAATSANVDADLAQLFRRIVFGAAINNTDDHLRNHGLLRVKSGWRLSPAFDINPSDDLNARHATSIAGAVTPPSIMAALTAFSDLFGLTANQASTITKEVGDAIKAWADVAARNGISRTQITRFAPMFEQLAELVA